MIEIDYIVNPEIENYLKSLSPVEDEVLRDMERLGKERQFPIVGPIVGRLLYQLVLVTGAKRVFEMGSGFGYSAYWFAKAMGEDGEVVFTDIRKKNAQLAKGFFRCGGVERRVRIEVGDSLEILDREKGEFDIIFNDIDKEYYPRVLEKAGGKLRRGGLLISDNMLWFGKVLMDKPLEESTKGIKEFTRILFSSAGFFTTIIPLRDGVSLSFKL